MLTTEEKEELQREIAEAKHQCRQSWETIRVLKKLLQSYQSHHYLWKMRMEKADRKLAEDERVIKLASPITTKRKEVSIELTREQVKEIALKLGVDISFENSDLLSEDD